MTLPGITRSLHKSSLGTFAVKLIYKAEYTEEKNRPAWNPKTLSLEIDSLSPEDLGNLIDFPGMPEMFSSKEIVTGAGGWQSWSAGWELGKGEKLPRRVLVIPELMKLTNRPGDTVRPDESAGHFILYFRKGPRYLCIASHEGDGLAPVTFRVNRKTLSFRVEVYCPGKTWGKGETLAGLSVFVRDSYFSFKDTIAQLYAQERNFAALDFLRVSADGQSAGSRKDDAHNAVKKNRAFPSGGYESWYNHYNRIDEKIILKDLDALGRTDNLIKLCYLDRKRPVVFQIDDGWEKNVGEWEIHEGRFPGGLKPLAERIGAAGYIPGLWLAPFLVTKSCRIFREKPEWVLREKDGKPAVAGFNHLWDKQYYSLDISRRDVLEYFDGLIGKVIDEWGFRYIKLDFLYTGFFYGNFARPGPPHEHYRRACEILTARKTSAEGLPVAYLGCGLPFGQSYRFFPLSRIGADTREMWEWKAAKLIGHAGRPSAYVSLMDTIGRSFMDSTIYINDPDVVFLRNTNCSLTETEKETIALVNFLLASQIMTSDDPEALDETALTETRRIASLYKRLGNDEYGALRIARDVFALESRSGAYTGLINLRERNYTLGRQGNEALFSRLGGEKAIVDHRVKFRGASLIFSPHSITITEKD